jgi:hypothetical protein
MEALSGTDRLIQFVKVHPVLLRDTYCNRRVLDLDVIKEKWEMLEIHVKKCTRSLKAVAGQSTTLASRYKNRQWAQQIEVFKPFIGCARADTNVLSLDTDEADPELDNADGVHGDSKVSTNTNSERQDTESPATQPDTASSTSSTERQYQIRHRRNRRTVPKA